MNNQGNIFILLFLLLFISIKSYIIIPFKELPNDEAYKFKFKYVEEFLDELSYLNLYSEFYLGATPKRLPVLLTPDIDYFAIVKNNEEQLQSSDNYNPFSSESLKSFEQIDFYSDNLFSYSSETFHFLMTEGDLSSIYSDKAKGKIDANNYLSFNSINFFNIKSHKNSQFCGIMGFAYNTLLNTSFINELYQKSLIDSTVWSVDFPDIDEDTFKIGNIIIGELPHIYNSKYYRDSQYFKTKIPKKDDKNNKSWEIKIDSGSIIKKYFENTHKKEIGTSMSYLKTISIDFGAYMMYAPKELFEQLKDLYFNSLFDSGICDYKKIKTDDDKIILVFCNKKSFDINEQMNFPTIYFDVQDLGGSFELNYKDVFVTKGDKVFLLIAFSSKEILDTIKLGQIFLYKYKLTFDIGNNEIGFYRTDITSKKMVHRIERTFRGKVYFVIIVLVILVATIYIFYKNRYKIKKKLIDYKNANLNISHLKGNNIEQGYELKTDN